MSAIKFSKHEKELLVAKLQQYFDRELEQEIGQFDAEFLLDFFSKELGNYYYNRGLYDAQKITAERVEQITEAIYELEQPVN
ncbi:DUF2164 domain-containing protein [Colwelliaceae bacterium 6441]